MHKKWADFSAGDASLIVVGLISSHKGFKLHEIEPSPGYHNSFSCLTFHFYFSDTLSLSFLYFLPQFLHSEVSWEMGEFVNASLAPQ